MMESKGIRLDHISKIYQDPKTGKDFKAVDDANLIIEPGSFCDPAWPFRLRKDNDAQNDRRF